MASADRTAFDERLTVPLWWWPIALLVASGLAVEIGLGVPGLVTWLPFTILLPATVALLWWAGRIRVRVDAEEFRVDDARLPLECVGTVEVLRDSRVRDALSAQLHPLAFVIQRPWVRSAVRVEVVDDEDPTPYWIVSTRRPERLRDALTRAETDSDSPRREPSSSARS
ncbi:DUF3093 domain-containing protein [Stackebrandtia nassauensis]|uniref:DUF3093 domain-containing protein n=1 Tax=Stackebrandtia nassauensis (strain DSM 44728 / CIP 108903 / NRRL B-16338 / NBRC 102104 / LLR-40K-21) TaxID=446470 RepID=D3Q5C9_STANL|nr:DUF3093 domain-containing protein [Stackebrandtia nassauensis]ADD44178.1 hypothetical protein Snas_4533 [Stackebrandtia nassauensis DSM 44728]